MTIKDVPPRLIEMTLVINSNAKVIYLGDSNGNPELLEA